MCCKADTLNSVSNNANGTAELGTAITELKKRPLSSEPTPGRRNVVHPALGEKSKIYLLSLHIKLGLIKIFVKAVDKESEEFVCLRENFPKKKVESRGKKEFSLVHKLNKYSKTRPLVQN
jgi:hypothetical protein